MWGKNTIVLCGLLMAGSAADAQIMRRPTARPVQHWAGVSVGLVQGFGVVDGSTGSSWDFGSGIEYAARIERPIATGEISLGLQASFARLPLFYSGGISSFSGEATASVTQVVAALRYGRGYSFHPIYELSGGLIGFSNFRSADGSSTRLSNSTDYDAKLAIGYGFGFGLSSTTAIEIVQEMGLILHQREGLAASQSNYPRIMTTRLGGKVAF